MVLLAASKAGDLIQEGLINMVLGLGVVFSVLIFLSLVIYCFRYLNKLGAKEETTEKPAPKTAPAPKAVPLNPAPIGNGAMKDADVDVKDEIDGETAAVILAAVAEEVGGEFEVKSIRKSE